MSSGSSFSWRRPHIPWGAKKKSKESKLPEKPERKPAIVAATTLAENVREPKPNESVVPKKTDYAIATVKEVLTLAQSTAPVIPVPFLKEVISVALKIIQLCEEASDVEQKVKELQSRVGNLMIVIVDHVTLKDEEGSKETVMKTAKGFEQNIKDLLSILGTISDDLTKISSQNRWVIAVYKQPNMDALDECMNRLSDAMEKFTLGNDLRASALINDLHARLCKIANKVDDVHHKVNDVHHEVDDVHHKVDDMHHKVDDIHTILFKLKRSVSDLLSRQEMPLKPEIFHGRDDLVEDIAQLLLQEETCRVCILGPGGMGKTSVSLAVVELPLIKKRFPGGNVVWVPCIAATSATLLLEILYIQLQIPGDKEITLENIISELDNLKQPRLIVVDNFETPWNGNQKQVGDILRRLAMLSHIAIFVTMRGRRPPCYGAIKWQSKNIESTDEAACLRIYHDIHPDSKNDPDVAKLLSALGHMPFAVTLMANLGAESRSSAKDLLDSWSESGTKILSNDPEQSMDQSIQLSVESDLVKRNPDAILLLAILSLLPAGTTNENLRWWAPAIKSTIPSAIATLSQAALLVENKRENLASPVLFVLPVVQSFMQQQNRISPEVRKQVHLSCCEYVLAHAFRRDDPKFPDNSKAMAAEDTNIQPILFDSAPSQLTVPSHRTIEALIAFSWYRCDTKPNVEIADHAVMAAKASGVQRYTASAVWCLGMTYFQLGSHDTSYNHMQEAYQLFNKLPAREVESQRSRGLCGICFVENARFILTPKKVVSLARDVEKKCSALSDDVVHGNSLLHLGVALHEVQKRQEALYYMDRARTIFKAVEHNPYLARAYHVISWVHLAEQRLPDALDAIEEAWKYAELTPSRHSQSSISLTFGRILFNTNEDTKAWKYIEISLINASYVGNRYQIAQSLEYMGYGYIRRGDYQNAYGAYEAAAEIFLGITTIYTDVVKDCKNNMVMVKRKQENPDEVVGFHRPSLDTDESLFYPPIQAFAT